LLLEMVFLKHMLLVLLLLELGALALQQLELLLVQG
jgi:hypothetical protein